MDSCIFRVLVAVASATVFAVVIVMRVISFVWWKPRKIEMHFESQGIRGPPYKLLLGNAKEMMKMMQQASYTTMDFSHDILPRVLSFYHEWTKTYGCMFLLWFGPIARINITNPEHVREILSVKFEDYEKTDAHAIVRKLEGDGLLNLKGKKWVQHRGIINPAFHMEHLRALIPVIAESATIMLNKWESLIESGVNEIEVSEQFQILSADMIARTAFGNCYEDGKHIFNMQSEQMRFAAEAFQKVILPFSRYFPTRKNFYKWRLDKEIRRCMTNLIQRREQESRTDTDLLGLMINAKGNMNSSSALKIDEIMEECKTFFFAGKQTTSNMLTWTMVLLAIHREWQEMARKEVLEVCGQNIPDRNAVGKLRIVDMIVKESLRLYPPIVALIRRTNKPMTLGKLNLPQGMELMIPILAIHHDQALWGDDVNQFNPQRFSKGVAQAAKHPLAFIPFGAGPRTCIGRNFTMLEAKVALTMILQRFSFDISPSYRHAPTVLMMLHPQHGAQIIFQKLG